MEQENDSEGSSLFASTFDHPREEAPVVAEAGQPEASPETEPDAKKGDTAPEAGDDRPRDEAGRFAPKPKEAETAAPPAAEREPQNVPVAALKDERSKRQEAERRAAAAEAYIAQLRQQQAPQPAAQPTDATDPMGALLDNPAGFVEQRAQQVAQQMLAPLQDQMFQDRLHFSVQRARSAPDFEEADALVNAAIQAAPVDVQQRIAAEMRRHPDPGQWVLAQGRAIKERQEFLRWKQSQSQPAPVVDPAPSTPATPLPASLATARGIGSSRQSEAPAGSPIRSTWRD